MASVAAQPAHVPSENTAATRERRYVTALAAQLIPTHGRDLPADPEELRSLIEAHRRYASAIIARHGGSVAQCHVRDVLAYFGYPVAQEYAAERAIHAGLALAEHLSDAAIPSGFSICVGVASGLVVADPAGEVLGEAPSHASRLHDLAEPGQVIIAASTHRELADCLFVANSTWQNQLPYGLGTYSGLIRSPAGRRPSTSTPCHRWSDGKTN